MKPIALAFDPSSTCTGYAWGSINGIVTALQEAGLIRPDKPREPAPERIYQMVTACVGVLEELMEAEPARRVEWVAVEVTSGKIAGRLAAAGKVSGLGIYGGACYGVYLGLRMFCERLWRWETAPPAVYPVFENVWTRGMGKEERAAVVAAEYPAYSRERDRGMDVADAIGLLKWMAAEDRQRVEQ